MQFVVRIETPQGEKTYAAEWERNLVADFGDAMKKAAMLFGNQVVVMTIGKFGLQLETFERKPRIAPAEALN
ncbi:MAG: hypothetical protein ACREHV_08555 [Rhizomicrobium sp.]